MTPRLKPQRRWALYLGGKLVGVPYAPINGTADHAYVSLLRKVGENVVRVEVRDARPCVWRYDEDTDAWDSECGEKWQFMVGGPTENHVRCCQGCGAKVKVK